MMRVPVTIRYWDGERPCTAHVVGEAADVPDLATDLAPRPVSDAELAAWGRSMTGGDVSRMRGDL